MWNMQDRTMKFIPMLFENNIEIKEICALETDLVFYDDKQRAHLLNMKNEYTILTRVHHLREANTIDHIGNKWFFYDAKTDKLCAKIESEIFCNVFCFTEDGKSLFGISQKESLLLMYRVDDGELLEKLFIENLMPHIQVFKDRLILSSNDELFLLCITEMDSSSLKRYKIVHFFSPLRNFSFRNSTCPTQRCALFENADWIDCHKDQYWTVTSSICAYGNQEPSIHQ
jgi:hypothetical protein